MQRGKCNRWYSAVFCAILTDNSGFARSSLARLFAYVHKKKLSEFNIILHWLSFPSVLNWFVVLDCFNNPTYDGWAQVKKQLKYKPLTIIHYCYLRNSDPINYSQPLQIKFLSIWENYSFLSAKFTAFFFKHENSLFLKELLLSHKINLYFSSNFKTSWNKFGLFIICTTKQPHMLPKSIKNET